MATMIEIVNSGLAHAAQSPIASLDQESMVADFISTIYDVEMKAALADHTWRFAREFATLNRLEALSLNKDMPQYQLPSDHVRTVGITVDGVEFANFEQSRTKLLVPGASTSTVVVLEYITENVDETDFPPHFVEVLAMLLGVRVARSVARNAELAADITKERENVILPRARSTDTQQAVTRQLRRSRILSVRRGAR